MRIQDIQLIEASCAGNYSEMQTALDQGAEINAVDEDGRSALIHTILNRRRAAAYFLIVLRGADLNISDNSGATALTYAITQNMIAVVHWLIERGATYKAKSVYDYPMVIAAQLGSINILETLVFFDRTKVELGKQGPAALEIANLLSDELIVDFFLSRGLSIKTICHDLLGNGLLKQAVRNESIRHIKFLLEKRADPLTALREAIRVENMEIFRILLNKIGSDYLSLEMLTKVFLYASSVGRVEMLKLLRAKGVRVDNFEYTPNNSSLFQAVYHENVETTKYLLLEGVDFEWSFLKKETLDKIQNLYAFNFAVVTNMLSSVLADSRVMQHGRKFMIDSSEGYYHFNAEMPDRFIMLKMNLLSLCNEKVKEIPQDFRSFATNYIELAFGISKSLVHFLRTAKTPLTEPSTEVDKPRAKLPWELVLKICEYIGDPQFSSSSIQYAEYVREKRQNSPRR